MKFEKLESAEPRDGDVPAMIEAIEELLAVGVDLRRPANNYQLKVAPEISYYPSKQTIFVDGEKGVRPERGIEALLDLLVEWKFVDQKLRQTRPTSIKLDS